MQAVERERSEEVVRKGVYLALLGSLIVVIPSFFWVRDRGVFGDNVTELNSVGHGVVVWLAAEERLSKVELGALVVSSSPLIRLFGLQ